MARGSPPRGPFSQDRDIRKGADSRLRAKHAALVEALTGRFDEHHGELARMLMDSYDALEAQIGPPCNAPTRRPRPARTSEDHRQMRT
jgi:hypothetical protein